MKLWCRIGSWLGCPMHDHDWVPIKVFNYFDTSYRSSREDKGIPSSNITFMCSECGKIKMETFFGSGHLTLEELRQAMNCTCKKENNVNQ